MIRVWSPPEHGGGCYECAESHLEQPIDIVEFKLGTWRIRLCKAHTVELADTLRKFTKAPLTPEQVTRALAKGREARAAAEKALAARARRRR